MRKHKSASGEKMFDADGIRLMLDYLDGETVTITGDDGKPLKIQGERNPVLRAVVLLGINCGFGASDCSALPIKAVDLDAGWIDFPRPKTGVSRRIPLWPETVHAMKAAIDARPEPKSPGHADLFFLTVRGLPLVRADDQTKCDEVAVRFGRLIRKLKLHRPGIGHYTLRHCVETIGGESLDQVAVNAVMGHADHSMAGNYRQRISDDRLLAVTDHVRQWLFPDASEPLEPSRSTRADATRADATRTEALAFRVVG